MTECSRALVIGYGNLDRQDDGVAYCVVNALRRCRGQEPLSEGETGLESLGAPVDSVFVMQLGPELLEIAAEYGRIIFVDAHVRTDVDVLHCEPVWPEYAAATFTHHMTPALFLALLQALHHREPLGYIVSIRGWTFNFERGLSPETEAMVQPAAKRIQQVLAKAKAPASNGAPDQA